MAPAQPAATVDFADRQTPEPYKYLGLAMLGCEPDAGEYSRGTKARLKAQSESQRVFGLARKIQPTIMDE